MGFPEDRPNGYDPDKVFDESANDWAAITALTTSGGEKLKNYLVVVSEDNKIYFGGA